MKCGNCGATFDPADILYRREDYGEKIACCPVCGVSDLIETEECILCGKEFEEDDIASGYCLECLWNAIDYETALEWMKQWRGRLADFLLNDWFGGGMKGDSSRDLDSFLEETFRRIVADEKLSCALSRVQTQRFLMCCRAFCLPHYRADFGSDGMEFAEWYADRLKKAKQEKRS